MLKKYLKYENKWLAVILLLYSIPILFGFYYIVHYAVNVPYWDQWDSIVQWTINWHEGNFDYGELIKPQNDSRPIVPTIVMLILLLVTDLNIKTMFFIGYLIYIASFILLLYLIKEDIGFDKSTLIFLIPLSFYMFNPYYMFRFIQNLGAVSSPILVLAVLLTIYLTYKSKESYPHYFGSILMGLVCTFTGAAGLSIWFVGGVQLLLQKMNNKWQKLAIWIISTLGTFYFYFIFLGFKSEGAHGTNAYSSFLSTMIHYPLHKFLCFMGVVGAEVIHNEQIALFFGFMIIAVFIVLIYINRNSLYLDRYSKWYALLTFGTLTSLELALTRSGSEALIFGAPDTIYYIPDPRHSLVIFLPLMCVYILALIYIKKGFNEKTSKDSEKTVGFVVKKKHYNFFLLGMISALMIGGFLLHIIPGMDLGEDSYEHQSKNQQYLENYEIAADSNLKSLHPNPDTVREAAAKLEKYGLSIFSNSYLISHSEIDWNSLTRVDGGLMSIDYVNNEHYSGEGENITIDKESTSSIDFSGWAVDDIRKEGKVDVFLVLKSNNTELVVPTIKTPRTDVARYFDVESYANSGWTTSVKTANLKHESYDISIRIIRTNGEEYMEMHGNKPIYIN
jgi:hypothetical protein